MSAIVCYTYRIPLTNALPGPDGPMTHRSGLLLAAEHPSGRTCWGEAAPLPGFTASLNAVTEAARDWQSQVNTLSTDEAGHVTPYPSDAPGPLRFAIDQIGQQWAACEADRSWHDWLGAGRSARSGNALWQTPGDRDMRQVLVELQAEHVSTIKVKVGRASVEDDLDRLDALFASLPTGMTVRLDANQAWSVEEADTVCEAVQHRRALEYIEEPLVPEADLRTFVGDTSVPIALDETIRQRGIDAVSDWPVAAFVVKPAWMGIRRVQQLAEQAGDVPVIVTSAYETGVGWRGTFATALQVTPPDRAIGMSTHQALAHDITWPPIPDAHGKLLTMVPGLFDGWKVDRDALEAVDRS
ncbi:MAG: o-succinylbenzoate synthase [Bacteroidota bacterium]